MRAPPRSWHAVRASSTRGPTSHNQVSVSSSLRHFPAAPPRVVVIGAGPAGLAAAAEARRNGLDVAVLESADGVGASWRGHYDRLRLHTTRGLSGLPGVPIPARLGRWVARDDFIAYLEHYARKVGVPIRLGVRVQRIEAATSGWRLITSGGQLE